MTREFDYKELSLQVLLGMKEELFENTSGNRKRGYYYTKQTEVSEDIIQASYLSNPARLIDLLDYIVKPEDRLEMKGVLLNYMAYNTVHQNLKPELVSKNIFRLFHSFLKEDAGYYPLQQFFDFFDFSQVRESNYHGQNLSYYNDERPQSRQDPARLASLLANIKAFDAFMGSIDPSLLSKYLNMASYNKFVLPLGIAPIVYKHTKDLPLMNMLQYQGVDLSAYCELAGQFPNDEYIMDLLTFVRDIERISTSERWALDEYVHTIVSTSSYRDRYNSSRKEISSAWSGYRTTKHTGFGVAVASVISKKVFHPEGRPNGLFEYFFTSTEADKIISSSADTSVITAFLNMTEFSIVEWYSNQCHKAMEGMSSKTGRSNIIARLLNMYNNIMEVLEKQPTVSFNYDVIVMNAIRTKRLAQAVEGVTGVLESKRVIRRAAQLMYDRGGMVMIKC